MSIFNYIFLVILLFSIKTKAQYDTLKEDPDVGSEDLGEKLANQNAESVKNPKTTENKKIPMKCIQNNENYCKDKFKGFQFSDGCHVCTCKTGGKVFCPKSPCKYYAKSYEEVVDYCKNIRQKNEISLAEQRKKKKEKTRKKLEKNGIKSRIIKKVKTSIKKEDLPGNKTVVSDRDQLVKSGKPSSELLNNELQNLMKSASNPFDKTLDKNVNSNSSLEVGLVGKQPENSDTTISGSNKGNVEEKPVEQSSEKSQSKPIEQPDEKEEPKQPDSKTKVNPNLLDSLKSGSKNLMKNFQIPPVHPEKTRVDKSLVKVSLEKLSDRKVIKQMIYQLAKNEIAIERLKHRLVKNHRTKILRVLKKLEGYNQNYKMKILKVVKREMIKSKSNPRKTKFYLKDITFFKKTYKKLKNINKILRKMKHDSSKKSYRRRRRYHGGTGNVKLSISVTFISVFLVFIVFNY